MSTNQKWMSAFLKDEKNKIGDLIVPKKKVVTPSPSLNWAMSGGFYKGYSICLYGPEGGGKSLTTMMAVGALMQQDPDAYAMIISTEMRPPTPERVAQLGVDPARLMIREANTLHDVFDYINSADEKFENSDGTKGGPGMRWLLENGCPIKALVIDSIKGLQGPKEQAAESVEKDFMGDISKFLNPSLRSILEIIRKYDLMTIFVQQVNMNMNPDEVKYQNKKWVVPSGQALKHFCENMALIERVESKDSKLFDETKQSIREIAVQRGHTIRVKVEKANLDSPFREAEFQVDYHKGIVNVGLEVVNLASNLGIIDHPKNDKGADILAQWRFGDRKWIGYDNVVAEAEANPDFQREIMKKIYEQDKG